jgi:CubicO group peptidase (beta-lactamase class C family)
MRASKSHPELFDPDVPDAGCCPRAEPLPERLDALIDLVREAEVSQSDALIVWEKGHLLAERYFGQSTGTVELMSITKSIVSLALGILIDEGKIPSVDISLSQYYAEWRNGPCSNITLRHVLTHSSGLQHNESAAQLEAQDDRTLYALGRPLVQAPGSCVSYNNEAVQLLPRIVEMVSGCPIDKYVKKKILDPLGIVQWSWKKDKAGVPQAYSGLSLRAWDLLRIGRWLLQPGGGLSLLGWIAPTPGTGYLWWVRSETFYAQGWLGQYLVVRPDRQRVAVRLHRVRQSGGPAENAQYGFPTFIEKLDRVAV